MEYKLILEKDVEKVFNYISSFDLEDMHRGCLFIYDDNFSIKFEELLSKYEVTWDLESYLEYRNIGR